MRGIGRGDGNSGEMWTCDGNFDRREPEIPQGGKEKGASLENRGSVGGGGEGVEGRTRKGSGMAGDRIPNWDDWGGRAFDERDDKSGGGRATFV